MKTKCNTCKRANKTCPVYPQNTMHCVEYIKIDTNDPTYYYRDDVTGELQKLED